MARPIRIEDLPEAILCKIFQKVPPWARRMVLPLVSKSWARLLAGPSTAWGDVTIARKVRSQNPTDRRHCRPDTGAMAAWLSRRAGAVRSLYVIDSESWSEPDVDRPLLPPSVLPAVLWTQANQLRVLHIDLVAIDLSSTDLVTLLECTKHLGDFTLRVRSEPACWDDYGAALMQSLAQLPVLQALKICNDQGFEGEGRIHPTVAELSVLSSPRLASMDLDMDTSAEGTLTFGALPALTKCSLMGMEEGGVVHLTTSSFSGAPNLTKLEIQYINIHPAPDCFTGLNFLVDLTLSDCDLRVVPPALAAVQHTLRKLNMAENDSLQIEECGYGILLALSALEFLSFYNFGSLTGDNLRWDNHSVQYLSRFLTEWQALRPGQALPSLQT